MGDSVRDSLRELALARIGRTQYALVSNLFFREQLTPECPMIALEAVVTHDSSGRRASNVAVYGVDQRFWEFHQAAVQAPTGGEVLLSPALAAELNATADDSLLVRMPRISAIPAESLHGAKDDPGRTLRTRMREVVSRAGMGEFSLRQTQGDLRAVFLPLARLQRELGQDGLANTALLKSAPNLRANYRLEDIGLRMRGPMLESASIIFSDDLVKAVLDSDPAAQPVFSYLANSFRIDGREVPYSLIAAVNRPEIVDENSILLNEWMRSELDAKIGDRLEIDYYLWDPAGRIVTKSSSFRVSGFAPIDPADQALAPDYPGITGTESISDWDPPFPVDLKKIRPSDEAYWDKYRATPKAYIRLAAGQKLWRSRYGGVTSIRVSPSFDPEKLRRSLDPALAGLTVLPVRAEVERAATGSTNFGEYFLYFSFFLIVSALLLAGLFFRFGLEQRAVEIRTLRALGYSSGALRRLFLTEGLILALAGGILGVLGAALYGGLILAGLRTWWIDAVGTRELQLHLTPAAIGLALGASLIAGPLVILLSLRAVTRRAPREAVLRAQGRGIVWALLALAVAMALLTAGGPGGFFGSGALLLTSAILALSWWLRGTPGAVRSVRGLGLRYTADRPGRSVLCVALIASAVFLVVSVEAFRRTGGEGVPGWRFYGETAIPVYHDPNSSEGREALNITSAPKAKWLPLRLRPGDDASCLNLYAPRNPRVVGVPRSFLEIPAAEAGAIPAAVDANTLEYVLHRKIGDRLDVGGATLQITKALTDSVFQSEILVTDSDFLRAYPEEGGFRVFLVDAPSGSEGALESGLSDYGLDLVTTAARVAAYHRVENTYLSTFQALGALGLVLGTIGIGAVLLRNVFERRRELALLRAVGYLPSHLARMTLAENAFLLVSGLVIGTLSALVAVVPVVLQRGGSIPGWSVLGLTVVVLITGMLASLLAVRVMLQAPLLDSLRSE